MSNYWDGKRKETFYTTKKRCSVPSIYCHNCFNFSTTTQVDLIYSIVKQQNVTPKVPEKWKVCHTEILGFFPPERSKNREHLTKKLGTRLHCPHVCPFLNNPIGVDTKIVPCVYQHILVGWKLEQGDHSNSVLKSSIPSCMIYSAT